MKKNILFAIMLFLSFGILASSCKDQNEKDEKKEESTTSTPEDLSQNPDYQKGLALVQQNDCLTCHQVASASTGPSFSDIAKKYSASDLSSLADKVIKGGSGVWGQVPMTPHPTLSKDDAEQIVKYILLLKSQ